MKQRKAKRSEEYNPSLIEAADRARIAYTKYRSEFDTLKFRNAEVYRTSQDYSRKEELNFDGDRIRKASESVWIKLAKALTDAEIDPIGFIAAQFQFATVNKNRAPEPASFTVQGHLSATCVKNWKEFSAGKAEDIQKEMETFLKISRAEIIYGQKVLKLTDEESYLYCLNGRQNGLSNLFRYCLAKNIAKTKMSFRAVARKFKMTAVLEFIPYRDMYLAYWAELLPKGFDRKAQQIYRDLYLRKLRT